jgi:hypothetical protein
MPSKRSGIAGTASTEPSTYWVENGGKGTFDNNERFDPINNTWTIEASMPTARDRLGVASIDDQIYVNGGGPNPGLTVSWENEIYKVNRPS